MNHAHTSDLIEILRGQVGGTADTGGGKRNLARLGGGGANQGAQIAIRSGGGGNHDVGAGAEQGDIRKIAQRVIRQLFIDRRIGGMRSRLRHQRITVGVGAHHHLRADLTAGPGAVIRHHRLFPHLGQRTTDNTRGDIGARPRGQGHHHPHRSVRKRLCRPHRCRCQHRRHTRNHPQTLDHFLSPFLSAAAGGTTYNRANDVASV